ncbi:MAG: type VI secretion system contractile sheath small subunit [Desulfobacterales bacterium]|nr:type VI secretion system contractile sheath small subunit [Desulfobacterales bacterium]
MAESTQHKLDRVRAPRVQITYDVEIGGAIEMKELPFVGGILADLSGNPAEPLPKLKDRKFIEIDRDNFNDVMASLKPRLEFQVENKLANDGSALKLELNFNNIDEFDPVNIINQITPLKKLLEARHRLSDLLTKLDGNDELDKLLQDVLVNTQKLDELKALTQPTAEA